jgi:hypothetical protein
MGLFSCLGAAPAGSNENLAAPAPVIDVAEAPETFTSYRKAWDAAKASQRPLLVVLNPPQEEWEQHEPVKVEMLREDAAVDAALQGYVVAEIDTGAEHGRRVAEVFGNPSLPRIVVIDDHQQHQLFATSDPVSHDMLRSVLERSRRGVVTTPTVIPPVEIGWLPPAISDCPNCRRQFGF